MLLIFIPEPTPRHHFTFSHIFNDLGIEFSITGNSEEFRNSKNLKFSYSAATLGNELHFHASGLLDEKKIKDFIPDTSEFQSEIILFPHNDKASALPYDVFSAVFYMLSRYEEYLSYTPDEHGRFEASQSLAYKKGFLQIPVVEIWIKQLKEVIKSVSPELKTTEKKFSFIPTYDIDQAFAYRHKGWKRAAGGFIKDSLTFRCSNFFKRLSALIHLQPDPFDTYDYLFELQKRYNLCPVFFFHPGTNGTFDKNCLPENRHVGNLIKNLTDHADFGIHPSYLSAEKPQLLTEEISRLERVSGKKITKARQHFIRVRLPDTYRNYITNGITDDYSMGFATEAGFRAGTSEPFYFFDLQKNEQTKLLVHPFVIMDGVFIQYHPASHARVIEQLKPLIAQVKSVNGTFISLFHNHAFCDTPEIKHWRDIYEEMIGLLIN